MMTGKIGQLTLAPFARIGAAKVLFIVPFFFSYRDTICNHLELVCFLHLFIFCFASVWTLVSPFSDLVSNLAFKLHVSSSIKVLATSERERETGAEEEEWVYKGLRQKKTWALSLIIEVLFTHSHITCQFLSPHCSCSNCQPSIITTLKIHDADQIITNQLKTFVWCFWAPKHLRRWSWAISFNAPPPKTKEPLFSWSKQWMFVSEILRPHVWSSEWHCWIVRIPKMDKTHPTAPLSI